MADFTVRERIERHVEYVLDSDPYGVPVVEVGQAIAVAWQDYAQRHGLDPKSAPRFDDWARVFTRDSEVVIRFTIEEKA